MATDTWTLTDVNKDLHESSWSREIATGVDVVKRTLQGGKKQGVESVVVQSSEFSFEILPSRGMNIWKVWSGDMEFGWTSPTLGPVHPHFVPLMEPGGLGWLDGFDELFVRCGLESNGAPEFDSNGILKYPLHGRIANLPAHKLQVAIEGDTVKIIGVVDESRFHFMKMRMTTTVSWKIGSSQIRIDDQIENLSASDHEFQMLYHINFGTPLLEAGSRFVAPVKTMVPRNEHAASGIAEWQDYSGPTPGYEEQVYFLELAGDDQGNTRTLLKNASGSAGAAIGCNLDQLPCFTVWKNTTSLEDGYVTGLEPATNFPNPRSYEGQQNRAVNIPGKQSTLLSLELDFLTSAEQVKAVEEQIRILTPETSKVFDAPQPGWCHGVD